MTHFSDADAALEDLDTRVTSLESTGGGGGGTTTGYPNPKDGGYYLDSFSGSNDRQKLDAAIAAQKGSGGVTNMAPILLPYRPISLDVSSPIMLYSGMKLVTPNVTGQQNPELSGGSYVGAEITLTGGPTDGRTRTPMFKTPGGSIYDVFMGGFSVQGSQGSGRHQFMSVASGTLYACAFDSLGLNFMSGVFGAGNEKCLVTQVDWRGTWTINNCWDTAFHLGGSDVAMRALMNIGVSGSSAQYGNKDLYFMRLSNVEIDIEGKIYISTMNGWRGVLIEGTDCDVTWGGGVVEGYKPSGTANSGPGPGVQFRIKEGAVRLRDIKVGQGMAAPDSTEKGLIQVEGGEVTIDGCSYYGDNMTSIAAIEHSGGRLNVVGGKRRGRNGSKFSGRPRLRTAAPAASQSNLTATYTVVHDDSYDLI